MSGKRELPIEAFASAADWARWLEAHSTDPDGLWLKFAKKGSGIASLTHAEALDEAICHGWIDGQTKSLDADYWLQRFAPRRRRSKWSKVNCAKALQFQKEGRLTPTGLAEVAQAQKDGRWAAAYDSPSKATVPPDLQAELEKHPRARAFFTKLSGQNRYAILHRIQDAKKPETRARRIAKFVTMLDEERTIY